MIWALHYAETPTGLFPDSHNTSLMAFPPRFRIFADFSVILGSFVWSTKLENKLNSVKGLGNHESETLHIFCATNSKFKTIII